MATPNSMFWQGNQRLVMDTSRAALFVKAAALMSAGNPPERQVYVAAIPDELDPTASTVELKAPGEDAGARLLGLVAELDQASITGAQVTESNILAA